MIDGGWLVMRCCKDWPITDQTQPSDLCPRCGMRRRFIDLRYDQQVKEQ